MKRLFPLVAGLAVLSVLLAAAFAPRAQDAPQPRPLAGASGLSDLSGTWTVIALPPGDLPEGLAITLVFGADGRLQGQAPCNRYNARFTLADGRLAVQPLASTRRACLSDDLTALESRFLRTLPQVDSAAIDAEGQLILSGAGTALLTARR